MTEEGTPRPEDDPQLASNWYEAAKAQLKDRSRAFAEGALRRDLAPQERLEKLQDAVARGKDARKFLAGAFWEKDVEPFLKSEAVLRPYSPKDDGIFSLWRLVTNFIFGSGQARVIVRLMEQLHRWDREGEEAEKILRLESEKRRRADEAARA